MHKIKFKKKFCISNMDKVIAIISLIIIILMFLMSYISKNITPVFLNYAEVEARKFISSVINKAIAETRIDDSLFIINESNNEINTIDFDMNKVNEILTNISYNIQSSFKAMDQGLYIDIPGYDSEKLRKGVIYELPSGLIFKNNLLSNIGPKIPIKLSMRGSIISNIDTSVTNYGINNAMIKVFINLNINQQVVLPFTLKKIEVNTSIPVIIKLVSGNIPNYYFGGMGNSSPIISVPLEE